MGLNLYDYHDYQKNQGAIELWNTLYMDLNLKCTIIITEAKAFEELNVFRYFEDQSDFSRPPPDLDLDFTGHLPDDEPEDCLCIII